MSGDTHIADRYELADRLGSGAMGDVYRATDTQSGATVAIKALKPDLLRHAPDLSLPKTSSVRKISHH